MVLMERKISSRNYEGMLSNPKFKEIETMLIPNRCYSNVWNFVMNQICGDVPTENILCDIAKGVHRKTSSYIEILNKKEYKVALGYVCVNNENLNGERILFRHCFLIDDNNEVFDITAPLFKLPNGLINISYFTFKEMKLGDYFTYLFNKSNYMYGESGNYFVEHGMERVFVDEEIELLNKLYSKGFKLNLKDKLRCYYNFSREKTEVVKKFYYLDELMDSLSRDISY